MAALIYFCTETYLKENTPMNGNISFAEILPLIRSASDMYTRSTLGTLFYNDLLTKYNAVTLSANELILVDKMKLSIAWRAMADATLELSFSLKNKGIQTQSGDYSNSAELKAIQFMYQKYVDKAEFYENRMKMWLIENKLLFSVFMDTDNKTDSGAHCILTDKSNTAFVSPIMFI